jgi:molecular chaperone GrpE
MSETLNNPPSPQEQDIVTDATAALDHDLQRLQEERDNLFGQLARVQADFKNAQKRLELEKAQAIQYANAKLIQSLIPALDNFDRALEVDPATTDAAGVLKGMRMVHEHILKILADFQVQPISPVPGTPFDPNLHQALMRQPDDRYEQPAVIQVYQRGYSFHDRVLRPAQVVVGQKE